MTLPPHLQARWDGVSRREQQWLLIALALLLGAALWWLALAPALSTLRSAERQHQLLDAQLQQMLRLQEQAQTLQAQAPLSVAEARRLLEASVTLLGAAARLSVVGERVTVSLKDVAPDALAQWLAQARLNARAVPSEARLQRNAAGNWDGMLVLALSAR